jgi:hypothetical protein
VRQLVPFVWRKGGYGVEDGGGFGGVEEGGDVVGCWRQGGDVVVLQAFRIHGA